MGIRPVIAIDCDGVLTDNYKVWSQHFDRRLCGRDHANMPTEFTWDCWKELCRKCWDGVLHRADVLYRHEPRPFVLGALNRLSQIADLHVVTSRPQSTEEITQNWLFWNGLLQYFSGVTIADDKRSACQELRAIALLDDAPRNLYVLEGSSTEPVIYNAPYNQEMKGIRVFDWLDAERVLKDLVFKI